MSSKKSFLILLTVLLITSLGGTVKAESGPYGIRADQIQQTNITKYDVDVIYTADVGEASTSLAYSSYIFTTEDIVFFSYADGTQVELYDSAGNPVSVVPNVLDKGEHTYVNTSAGVYTVAGSNKFAVLTGDATTNGISGYYAMDADGRGVSREFYTYVPPLRGHCEFIVFAYQDGTTVTIQQEVVNGVYEDIASFTLDKGDHWANSVLSNEYLHVIADKPVSALTSYDQSYFVPSFNGGWSGTEFYTYVSDIENWPEDLTVIAYNDDTSVSIKDSDTQEIIWEVTLDSNQAHVVSYPTGTDKYFTITSNKVVTVDVQPWVAKTSNYYQSVFVPDKDGTGIGTELIGPTLNGGYLYILAHTDDTNINLYNSQTGEWQASYTLNKGEIVNANPGNGLWKIMSDKNVSVYSGWGVQCIAEFAPLSFSVPPCYPFLGKADDVNTGDCVGPYDEITYTIDYNYPAEPNYFGYEELADFHEWWLCDCNSNNNDCNGMDVDKDGTVNFIDFAILAGNWLKGQLNDVNIIDYLPGEVDFVSASNGGVYDSNSHSVRWEIGTLEPNNFGSVTLTVKVNPCAEQAEGEIANYCEIKSSNETLNIAYEYTPICYNWLVAEDFDSYANTDELDDVWQVNSSATRVTLETTKVRSGKSMKYSHQNWVYPWLPAEAEADTLELSGGIGADWTIGETETLALYFFGQTINDANEQMYVKLTDGSSNSATVEYDGDANDVREPYWHEWNIALSDFAGVNMNDVRNIVIGFGDGVAPVAPTYEISNVYFDDIRLYPSRCLEGPKGDLTGDCVVDYRDLKIMIEQWLDTGYCCEADLYKDNKVNFRDFAILAENWLVEGELWPE